VDDPGQPGRYLGKAQERRHGEGRVIAEAGKTLERGKTQESIERPHRVTPRDRQRAREREQSLEDSRQVHRRRNLGRSRGRLRIEVPRASIRQEGNVKKAAGDRRGTRLVARRKLWRVQSQECQRGEIDPQGARRKKPLGG